MGNVSRWGRWMRRAAVAAVVVALPAATAGAAILQQAREAAKPGYAVPNLLAIVFCVTLIAIPCKRFGRE